MTGRGLLCKKAWRQSQRRVTSPGQRQCTSLELHSLRIRRAALAVAGGPESGVSPRRPALDVEGGGGARHEAPPAAAAAPREALLEPMLQALGAALRVPFSVLSG